MIVEPAPAKINLYLHVGPLRDDGLHDLASLFVFTESGDEIAIAPADQLTLDIQGPFASALHGSPVEENLVWRAAIELAKLAGIEAAVQITLTKNLPVAAGIGGGSADAAAALIASDRYWDLGLSRTEMEPIAFALGADVPACLARAPINVTGAGEILSPGPVLPSLWVCLVNPGVETPTGPIFRQFDQENPMPAKPVLAAIPDISDDGVSALFAETRNDLQGPAIAHCPVIAEVMALVTDAKGVLGARMSGSGATCFALFAERENADEIARAARARGWWAMVSKLAQG